MGKWRERIEVAKDTVDDLVFRATEPFKRCPYREGKKQCDQDKGHKGNHTPN